LPKPIIIDPKAESQDIVLINNPRLWTKNKCPTYHQENRKKETKNKKTIGKQRIRKKNVVYFKRLKWKVA
jgi:hypothetical protein